MDFEKLAKDPKSIGTMLGTLVIVAICLFLLPYEWSNYLAVVYSVSGLLSVFLITPNLVEPKRPLIGFLLGFGISVAVPLLVPMRIMYALVDMFLSIVFLVVSCVFQKCSNL